MEKCYKELYEFSLKNPKFPQNNIFEERILQYREKSPKDELKNENDIQSL